MPLREAFTIAVLAHAGSPISTGLFLVRLADLHHAANFFIAPDSGVEF